MQKKMPRKIQRGYQKVLNDIVKDHSDCSICGLCCKDQLLTISRKDANIISRKLGIDKREFYEKYTHYNEETFETAMNMPCPFLKDNRCTIYDYRPEMCKNYPVFLSDDGIVVIQDIEACAKATHFNEAFLDYCSKYLPEFYKRILKHIDESSNSEIDDPIKRAMYSVNGIARFTEWLSSKDE
jgi:Fe-S-cluster containining protein